MDCPLCSSSMKLRTARQGRNAGKQFWGCSRYPACHGTRPANVETVKRPAYYSISPRFRRLTRRSFSRYQVVKISTLFVFALLGTILYFEASIVGNTPSRLPNNAVLRSVDGRNTTSRLPAPVSVDIVDGDTVRSDGKVYRLVGFNTPEAGIGARCEQERMLATKATQRLRQLVGAGNVELELVRCACQPGTEGTDRCNYGRSCAILRAGGRDVGPMLIAEGLAERYVCGPTSCPRRRDWCN